MRLRASAFPHIDLSRQFALFLASLLLCFLASSLQGCSRAKSSRSTLVFLIESNPANLDPRFATDGQSQHLDSLLFSSLVARDDRMDILPDLATSWDTPDPLTYIFHLRPNVHFHGGRPLTSADVKSTFDFILNAANHSPKRGGFRMIAGIQTPDSATVIFHLKEPYASFLFALSRPAVGIVPRDAGPDFSRDPIGSGPFRFVSQSQDDEVILDRNSEYFGAGQDRGGKTPAFTRVRFRVVPDAIVRALELRKGSADIEISSLNPDLIPVLARQPSLAVSERAGSNLNYLSFNCLDPELSNSAVRQALAYATDRAALIKFLLHGQATLATGVIPPTNWAYEPNVTQYALDLPRAEQLLDSAGFRRRPDGIRLRLTLKTSTEEQARLIGAALQDQWRRAGIQLEVRPLEIATLLSDAVKGNFQITLLRWVGANNDPDFFDFAFSTRRIPPDGANRGRYRNPQIDALTNQIRSEPDRAKRKVLCSQVQKILAAELPYLPLWFNDAVSVHRRSLGDLALSPSGDFDFLADLTDLTEKPASASASR